MADENKGIFKKAWTAAEIALDQYITKSRTNMDESEDLVKATNTSNSLEDNGNRLSITEAELATSEQYGFKEKPGMISNAVLKNMARRDSIITAIHQTRLSQTSMFTQRQKTKYEPGWIIEAEATPELTDEEKLELQDPNMDEDTHKQKVFELEKKRIALKKTQDAEIKKVEEFIKYCGQSPDETDTTHKRYNFPKFVNLITRDRLTYNYAAVEMIPTRAESPSVHHFYPVSSGTIKFVSKASSDRVNSILKQAMVDRGVPPEEAARKTDKPFKFVQNVRGVITAAWTEDWFIYEAANPTIDPEDNGYAPGELELLIGIVTAHLYAEAHNRNFFVQGIGTKGLLHIKGDNISRAQLEAFKRQWFNQISNTRNSFRPPIIGMADEVKWVPLAQSNREMEFEQWMNYLIRICCAVYQIDPAEINFDISKVNTSTLNESSNETRIKASRDKGLKPLLEFIENIINDHILPRWNKDLAKKYKFRFVGLDAETRTQEIDRLKKETEVWKTINEARKEMGKEPLEHGDVILNANFTQYINMANQQKQMEEQAAQEAMGAMGDGEDGGGVDGTVPGDSSEVDEHEDDFNSDLEALVEEVNKIGGAGKPKPEEKGEETKKSQPTVVEYYINSKKNDED